MPSHPIGLGIITPSANSVLEGDYPRLGLSDVGFHFSAFSIAKIRPSNYPE